MNFTEKEILDQLDLAFKGIPGTYYPVGRPIDIRYSFFLDLEHGYCCTAGSKIHLYADNDHWAIVFEKSGYGNRSYSAEIELDYVGNCIDYPIDRYPERNYITNCRTIVLISSDEYGNIADKNMDSFELISPGAPDVKVRDTIVKLEHKIETYTDVGILPSDYNNPNHLISFEALVRYLNEIDPAVISAKDEDIKVHLPDKLPLILTIDKFHFESIYDKNNLPSTQETYKLIAKVLLNKDPHHWRPLKEGNNHWSNWQSGNL